MDIRNVTQFAHFLSQYELMKLDPSFGQLITCINNFAAGCNCHKRDDKLKIYAICNKLYVDNVRLITRFKNEFLNKSNQRQLSFYNEHGHLLISISR